MARNLKTSVVGSYPQPDWLVDRALLTKMMAPRVRVARGLARTGRAARAGAGRRDARRDPRSRARRRRHHHGRRDPPRELLEQVRERARRHRRASASARSIGRTGEQDPGADRLGPDQAPRAGRGRATCEFLRANTDKTIKITLPGPVHDGAASRQRALPRRREPRARVRRRGQRGNPRSLCRRRRRRAARRAVAPGARRARAPLRRQGDQPRARGRATARRRCTCASVTRRSSRTSPRAATRSSPSSRTRRRSRSRSRRRSRSSI